MSEGISLHPPKTFGFSITSRVVLLSAHVNVGYTSTSVARDSGAAVRRPSFGASQPNGCPHIRRAMQCTAAAAHMIPTGRTGERFANTTDT